MEESRMRPACPSSRLARTAGRALALTLLSLGPAFGQLSSDSWWPKFQRDAQNTGSVPLVGFVGDAHVIWAVQLHSAPVMQNYATPVLSPDNTRLYVGGPGSKVTAVDAATGALLWTVTLGDGTGAIWQTAAVGVDGSIYVGSWDTSSPYDGFCKLRDEGDLGQVIWSFPLRRQLASPTITADGLIIVGGQGESGQWAYFALEDLGQSYNLAWTAAILADPNNPASTGVIGSSPALSADSVWTYGGSYENRSLWQIDTQTGDDLALPLDYYCYMAAPLVDDTGYVFIAEGMDFANPNDQTQGKLYAFRPDDYGQLSEFDSLALKAGHLNGGTAALGRRPDGGQRLYVPANGFGKSSAKLIAVDFDPEDHDADPNTPALTKAWEIAVGPSALAFPQAVATKDRIVYMLGPADHKLYAVRDAGTQAGFVWLLALSEISRATQWSPDARGPQGVIVGPDGTIYWNAVDGYLYAIRGWPRADLDGNEELDEDDLHWLAAAIVDPEGYAQRFPEIDATVVGDLNGNGRLDFFDLNLLLELLAEG